MTQVGRHSASRAGTVTSAVIAGVVLVAGGGAWAVASMLDDDRATGASSSAAPSTTSGVSDPVSPSPSASESSAEPSPTPSASASASAASAAQAHATCRAQVAAAERLARASASSALHWRQHTQAQLDWSARRITLAQRTKIYADTRARGPADVQEWGAATKALAATGRACTAPELAAGPATDACRARMSALVAVHTAAGPVQRQWTEHLAMMAAKAHADMGAYHQRWLKMVVDAQPVLRAYDAKAAALARAPACT